MWLFTKYGFFSAVENRDDTSGVCIRARVKEDLDKLRAKYLPELSKTHTSKGSADYPYRGFCTKNEFAAAAARAALDISYKNFKSEVAKVDSWDRERLYSRVWGVMKDAEKKLEDLAEEEKKWKDRQPTLWDDKRVQGRQGSFINTGTTLRLAGEGYDPFSSEFDPSPGIREKLRGGPDDFDLRNVESPDELRSADGDEFNCEECQAPTEIVPCEDTCEILKPHVHRLCPNCGTFYDLEPEPDPEGEPEPEPDDGGQPPPPARGRGWGTKP